MLELILKLYTTAMLGEVRSPVLHLFGPPGCGKSTFAEQAAALLGVQLHIINVSRISPLELEGVQMPDSDNTKLNLLTATFWTRMKDGDILLLDEFLRGFPEVYNGLLDILTSRQVGGFMLPKVFIMAASNTTVAYDKALEDRLLHLPVPDPRSRVSERKNIAKVFVEETGLLPMMADSSEMESMLNSEVLPMYEVLDALKNKTAIGTASVKGHSIRNLIGQLKLRHVISSSLRELVDMNNRRAIASSKFQYVVLLDGKNPDQKYVINARKMLGNPRLSPIQDLNLRLNLQLLELEEAKKGEEEEDDEEYLTV